MFVFLDFLRMLSKSHRIIIIKQGPKRCIISISESDLFVNFLFAHGIK